MILNFSYGLTTKQEGTNRMEQNLSCPFCNSSLTKKKFCDGCGEDMTLYKKAVSASNAYYNRGLSKAKVRDLSGAATDLRKSLELYKNNIQARNLLGLVYYEMGEVVSALSEWVISKNFMPKKNELADYYINDLQSNPTKLENYNQAIKKYNSALLSANQDSEDLAIIQLKKVVTLNPKFLRAMHLLALLYIKTGEKERAHRILIKASKIDIANTTTMKYLAELGYKNDGPDTVAVSYANNDDNTNKSGFIPSDIYKDDKPNIMAFVNLIIGIVVGIAVSAFLIVPAVRKNASEDYSVSSNEYKDLLSEKDSKIKAIQTDKEVVENKLEEVQGELNEYKEKQQNEVNNSESLNNMMLAVQSFQDVDFEKTASYMNKVDLTLFKEKAFKELYNSMKTRVVEELYNKGYMLYTNNNDYVESLKVFKKIYGIEKNNADVTYFLARSFDQTGDIENAKKYYKVIVKKFADNKRASESQDRLDELG